MHTLNALFAERDAGRAAADAKIQAHLSALWDDCAALQSALERLASFDVGDRYYWGPDGDIAACVDCPIPVEAREREYFEAYVAEHFAYYDAANETLWAYAGPSLVIDTDGDVFDQDGAKTVIRASEYCSGGLDRHTPEAEARLNALIEAYMERTGCFPGVFRADRHGNLFPVNTNA